MERVVRVGERVDRDGSGEGVEMGVEREWRGSGEAGEAQGARGGRQGARTWSAASPMKGMSDSWRTVSRSSSAARAWLREIMRSLPQAVRRETASLPTLSTAKRPTCREMTDGGESQRRERAAGWSARQYRRARARTRTHTHARTHTRGHGAGPSLAHLCALLEEPLPHAHAHST